MPFLALKRVGNTLVPVDASSEDALQEMPFGVDFGGDVDRKRNLKHLRMYWALCRRIGIGVGRHEKYIDRAFKIEMGLFEEYQLRDGRLAIVPGSIAFANMKQSQFDDFWKNCMEIMFRVWGIPAETVNDIIEDKRGR